MTKKQVKQCKSKDAISKLQCQGIKGHKGWHWCYRANGWLNQWKRKKDIKGPMDIAASQTPPDHAMYIHPKDKIDEAFYYYSIWSKNG